MIAFFGCMGTPGHYWHSPEGRWLTRVEELQLPRMFTRWIDGGFAPRSWRADRMMNRGFVKLSAVCFAAEGRTDDERRQIIYDTEEFEQGKFLVHHHDEHTLMSWWDRTQGDTRPACNSNILAPGTLTCDEMFDVLRENFPGVVRRLINGEVVLHEVIR